ncbi:MAG: hypothetical protein Q7V56_01330 [Gammaproteobacteria bacterium]|nr:hypothetical protein [Gammaproteobacteria bacterium]
MRCLSCWIAVAILAFSLSASALATSLTLSGGWSYQYGTNTVTLTVGQITNDATGGNSGSLRLELWAFDTPYAGLAQPGYKLATHQMSVLNGGASYSTVSSGSVTATLPPVGTWHIALLLSEYNGSTWIMRHYLLGTAGETLVCASLNASCTVAAPPLTPARSELSSNRSHYTTSKDDTLTLSGIIEAGAAAGTLSDIFIRVSLNDGAPLYLGSDLQWSGIERPVVGDFALTDVIVPNFYSLPSQVLPEGNYLFEILVAESHPHPLAMHALVAHGATLTTVWPKPIIVLNPPQRAFTWQAGVANQFDFAPWVTGGAPPYYFILGTFGGFPPIGVVLQPNGMLTGTPTVARGIPASFMVCAVDLAGNETRDCVNIQMGVDPAAAPPTGTYLFANWSCGSSGQCASVMGASQGATGMFCSVNDCNSWGNQNIPGGYSCATTASVASPRVSVGSNGLCNRAGVDF